ncbi:hypothetical protein GGR53DRAFT_473256 [Hypoxylon sp. FL1150]|nr:hypothetical protein GGR53DRAFT_473256 [Hypoxylon sp. FL1150]
MPPNTIIKIGAVLASHDDVFPILDMPVELVLDVLKFMDRGDILAFSLTCKTAHGFVFESKNPERENLGKECARILRNGSFQTATPFAEQFAFLEKLVIDLPYHFICKRCRKLHDHRSLLCHNEGEVEGEVEGEGEGEGEPAMSHCLPDPNAKGLLTFGPLWPQHAFAWDDAYEAMMQRFNSSFVLPVPQLTMAADWKLARLGPTCDNPDFLHGYVKLDTEAVFARDKLCLHKTQRVVVQADRLAAFLQRCQAPMEHVFRPCPHKESLGLMFALLFKESVLQRRATVFEVVSEIIAQVGRRGLDGWQLNEGEGAPSPSPLHPYGLPLYGCRYCATDFMLTIHNHGRGGVEIILDAYQDLGDCGTTHPGKVGDNNWSLCCGAGYDFSYDSVYERRDAHPAVRPDLFRTRPGKSAMRLSTAPYSSDVFALGEHERKARFKPLARP